MKVNGSVTVLKNLANISERKAGWDMIRLQDISDGEEAREGYELSWSE